MCWLLCLHLYFIFVSCKYYFHMTQYVVYVISANQTDCSGCSLSQHYAYLSGEVHDSMQKLKSLAHFLCNVPTNHRSSLLLNFVLLTRGESGLTGQRRNKPEPGGAEQPDVRGGPTPDLHPDAPGLLPPFPQLLCLQRPPGQQEAHLPRHLVPPSLHHRHQTPTRLLLKLQILLWCQKSGLEKSLPRFWLKRLSDIRDSWLLVFFIYIF